MNVKTLRLNFKLVLCCLFFATSLQAQQEQITSFLSDIIINRDASLSITETITVIADQQQIKQGIVREFPTNYRTSSGLHVNVTFDVQTVLHNGRTAPYVIKDAVNGKRIFIGDKSKIIDRGKHTYTISYRTTRQLGFFEDHDELYFNITGNGWRLPIDFAQATIHLPAGVPADQIKIDAWTGYQDEEYKHFTSKIGNGVVTFSTTKPLATKEGITVFISWPKGFVVAPTAAEEWRYFVQDNWPVLWVLFWLIVIILTFIIIYRKFKHKPGTIIPRFYPPKDFSPGDVKYLTRMGYDSKILAAELVQMGVQGNLTITYTETKGFFSNSGQYTLQRPAEFKHQLNPLQKIIVKNLLPTTNPVVMDSSHKEVLQATAQKLKSYYANAAVSRMIIKNTLYPTIISAFVVIAALPLLFAFSTEFSKDGMVIFFTMSSLFILSSWLCTHYTKNGSTTRDELEGFKLFLTTTETERLKIVGTPPTKTPELYETYLPYAIALDAEQAWSKQFVPVFAAMAAQGHPYVPIWYHGSHPLDGSAFDVVGFSNNLTYSFNQAISSASTPPGSSSGGGGGGKSGGGGGGGGGGGW